MTGLLKMPTHYIPLISEIIDKVGRAKVFTKLDL